MNDKPKNDMDSIQGIIQKLGYHRWDDAYDQEHDVLRDHNYPDYSDVDC